MDSKEFVEKEGVVLEALPNASFRVKFDDETMALAQISGKIRKFRIKILVGDRVRVEFSPSDLNRGRITYRFK